MKINLITKCENILQLHNQYKDLLVNDEYSIKVDLIRNLNRFIASNKTKISLSKKDFDENMSFLIGFLLKIQGNKPRNLIEIDSKSFNKIERGENLVEDEEFGKPILFLNLEDKLREKIQFKYQLISLINKDILEKWGKISELESEDVKKTFAINNKSNFNYNVLSLFKEATRKIFITDPYLLQKTKAELDENLKIILENLIPEASNDSIKTQLIILVPKYSKNGHTRIENTDIIKSFYHYIESIITEFKNISVSIVGINNDKLHDRYFFTDCFTFLFSTSVDFMAANNRLKKEDNQYSLTVIGFGELNKYAEHHSNYLNYVKYYNEEIKKENNKFIIGELKPIVNLA